MEEKSAAATPTFWQRLRGRIAPIALLAALAGGLTGYAVNELAQPSAPDPSVYGPSQVIFMPPDSQSIREPSNGGGYKDLLEKISKLKRLGDDLQRLCWKRTIGEPPPTDYPRDDLARESQASRPPEVVEQLRRCIDDATYDPDYAEAQKGYVAEFCRFVEGSPPTFRVELIKVEAVMSRADCRTLTLAKRSVLSDSEYGQVVNAISQAYAKELLKSGSSG